MMKTTMKRQEGVGGGVQTQVLEESLVNPLLNKLDELIASLNKNNEMRYASNANFTQIASATTSQVVLLGNSKRKGALFWNNGTGTWSLLYGDGVATNWYTVQISPGSFFEMPIEPLYIGRITGVSSNTNGFLQITELL